MRRITKRTRIIAGGASTAVAAGLFVALLIINPGWTFTYVNEMALGAILVALIPSAVLDFEHQRWMSAIEDQLPSFVRGISEAQETGATLAEALANVVDNKMVRRPLSDEVRRITIQMSWGLSFEEALQKFRERIGSPVVSRFTVLVLEASRSGGQVRKVFSATSGFMDEMREMDRETSSQMRPYLIIVYVAFFVFCLTSIILLRSFFAPLEGYQQILSSATILGVSEFKDFFYRTMLVSGMMSGLMAGKLGERRVPGGLKHSIVLMVAGYIGFFLMIPPNWMGA